MKQIKILGIATIFIITLLSLFSFVSATWTESSTYLTSPMNSQNVGTQYAFIYGLDNQCLTYGDSAISHRYGYCWDGTAWDIDNSLKLPSNEYQQYQGFGGVFNLNNQEVIISAIKYHTDANYYEIRAYQNDGSMTINQSYVSGLPTSVSQYDTIINVPIDNNKNLFYISVGGTFHAYTWDGSTWQSNTTIENNFLNAINYSAYTYAEMTPQIIDGTTYLIFNKDRIGFFSAYWDGSSWVNDNNHVADLNSMIPYLNVTTHDKTTLSSFYDGSGNYILVNYYYNGSNHYNFYEYENTINYQNVTLTLKDNNGISINNFSVEINSHLYTTTTGTLITDIQVNNTLSLDLNYKNILVSGYGYIDDFTINNHIFDVGSENYEGIGQKYYKKIIINNSNNILNYNVSIDGVIYQTTNGTINTQIELTNPSNKNITFVGFKDGYKNYNTEIHEGNFTQENNFYTIDWNYYYKQIVMYAYDVNNSVLINNFSVTLDNGQTYSTSNGVINTGIYLSSPLSYDIYYNSFSYYNSTHEYKNRQYNNILFNENSNTHTGNILIGKIPPLQAGQNSINWTNSLHYELGTYTNTLYSNGVKLNNDLTGSYCSAIIDTGHLHPIYDYMTFIVNVSDMVYQKGLNISNILLHYNMDDSGINIHDLSSYNNDGVYNGVLNSQSGVFNYSIGFDGIDDKILTPINLSGVSHFTLGGWFYRDNSSQRMDISQSDNYNQNRIKLLVHPNGLIYGVFSDGYGSFSKSPTGWFHLMMVYDGTGNTNSDRLKLYYNGIKQSLIFSNTIESITPTIPNNLNIGYDIGSDSYTDGYFDEILILNESLNDSQIRYIYNATKPIYYENVSVNRTVNFTIRSCNESSCLSDPFIDVDDTSSSDLSNLDYKKYVQWCVNMTSTDALYSPSINNVKIFFHNVSYDPTNHNPTIPNLNLSLNVTNISSMLTATAYNSSDADNDILTYYYEFSNGSILRSYSLNNTINVTDYTGQIINVKAKSYDGQNYSNIIEKSILINEYVAPYTPNVIHYVNETEAFKLGTCPTTKHGYTNMWLIIGIIFIVALFSIAFKNVGFVIGSGALLIFMSLSVMACGYFLGVVIITFGLGFIITGLSIKH